MLSSPNDSVIVLVALVVGVGGIHTADQARELLSAGCAAVQIYTGLIFEGPGLISRLNRELSLR